MSDAITYRLHVELTEAQKLRFMRLRGKLETAREVPVTLNALIRELISDRAKKEGV